ncbi:FCS-Like Zinc finger 13-like [Impatiens glandulifera]|uniref:FCS-Like Zinc finger 13-like n=1 Tax=Impatiens glandulifera TaxID=253017 RepID=UPI001FB0D4F8|nr:FCS-Like Zinc finger 13-like [Impatiens glandulifera]
MKSLMPKKTQTSGGAGRNRPRFIDGPKVGPSILDSITTDDPSQLQTFNKIETISISTPSFLNNCFNCWKRITGKDVYIYRGESSFCSDKCRNVLISADEDKARKTKKQSKVDEQE